MKKIISEGGIRNIRELSDRYKKAKIYFHQDLDGVATALAMKKYLEDNGIKVVVDKKTNKPAQECKKIKVHKKLDPTFSEKYVYLIFGYRQTLRKRFFILELYFKIMTQR